MTPTIEPIWTPAERVRLAKYTLAQLLLATAPLGEKRVHLHFPQPAQPLDGAPPIHSVAICKFDIRNFTAAARNLAQHQETVLHPGDEPGPAFALALFTDDHWGPKDTRDQSFPQKPWALVPEFYENLLAAVRGLLMPQPGALFISSREV